jgi:6-phosphogluconolactonase
MRFLYRFVPTAIGLCLTGLLVGCSNTSAPVSTTTSSGSSSSSTSSSTTTTSTGGIDTTYIPPSSPIITAKAKFAYTGNQGSSLSGYSVDTSTGELTPLNGFPMTLGLNPTAVTRDPQNRFLIVADIAADLLHVFAIDSTSGALTEVSPSPYKTIREPVAVTTDPAGTHVYVASMYGNQLGAFNLSSTGVLTPISGSPFSTNGTVNPHTGGLGIVMDPAGKFLYSMDLTNLYTFSVDSGSGALTLLQTIAGPGSGDAIAMDPAGYYVYAVGTGTNFILSYSITPITGLLVEPYTSSMTEKNGAYTISISPDGQYAFTIENNNDLVSYVVNNGIFFPTGTVYSGIYGENVSVDPSGKFVYVPQACSNCPSGVYNVVNEFSVGIKGALTKLSPAQIPAGVTPWGMTVTSQ